MDEHASELDDFVARLASARLTEWRLFGLPDLQFLPDTRLRDLDLVLRTIPIFDKSDRGSAEAVAGYYNSRLADKRTYLKDLQACQEKGNSKRARKLTEAYQAYEEEMKELGRHHSMRYRMRSLESSRTIDVDAMIRQFVFAWARISDGKPENVDLERVKVVKKDQIERYPSVLIEDPLFADFLNDSELIRRAGLKD